MDLDPEDFDALGFGNVWSESSERAYRKAQRDWKAIYKERLWYFRSKPVVERHREIAREWYRRNRSKQARRRKYAREWYRRNKAKSSPQGELFTEAERS